MNEFLTYAIDKSKNIYCLRGIITKKNKLKASLVYVNVKKSLADRYNPKGGFFYARRVLDTKLDNSYMGDLDKNTRAKINKYKVKNQNDFFLEVPLVEIKKTIPPMNLKKKYSSLSKEIKKFVDFLEIKGIPKSKMFLYGTEVLGLERLGKKKYKYPPDFDLAIVGLKYSEKLNQIKDQDFVKYTGYKRDKTIYSKYKGDNKFLLAKYRSKSKLAFILPKRKGRMIDIRFIRESPKRYMIKIPPGHSSLIISGKVLDDLEGPTMPAIYSVITKKGKPITVITDMFRYLGAAWKGDYVKARGYFIRKNNTLFVTKYDNYISPIKKPF
ncbi:hypothetical protein J4422_02315 [Candidatus Pacearchaeota archaeon]|nr:hypothetical protein [Candidatus Pacearchaeota archaeon]